MRHSLPLPTAALALVLCAGLNVPTTQAQEALVTKSIATSAEPQPKLVLQTAAIVQVAAWTPDDRFIVSADDLGRLVTVWDARSGNVVDRFPFPALDPKREVQSWSLNIDAALRLTIEANIREPDSTFCTGLKMQRPMAKPGEWQVQSGEANGPCIGLTEANNLAVSHNGLYRLNIKDYPATVEDRRGRVLRQLEKPEPSMAFAADLDDEGRRMAMIMDAAGLAGTEDRVSRVLIYDMAASQVIASYLIDGYYTQLHWLNGQRILLSDNGSGRSNDPTRILLPKPGIPRIIDAATGRDTTPPMQYRCHLMPLPGGTIIAAAADNCLFKGATGRGLERYDPASGWQLFNNQDLAGSYVEDVLVSKDGKRISALTTSDSGHAGLIVFDAASGALTGKVDLGSQETGVDAEFAADGNSIELITALGHFRWDMTSAAPLLLGETAVPATALVQQTLSRDGKHWFDASGITTRRLSAISIADGTREPRLVFDNIIAQGAVPKSPLRWVVTALDGIVLWKPPADGDPANPEILRSYVMDNQHFFAVTPSGRYDTDLGADTEQFRWLVTDAPFQSLGPQTFMRDFFEPRLSQRMMGCYAKGDCDQIFRPLPSIAKLNRVLPQVRIAKVQPGLTGDIAVIDVEVRAGTGSGTGSSNQHSDAFDLRLFRNGSLVSQSPGAGPDPARFDLAQWRAENRIVPDRNGNSTVRFTVHLPTAADKRSVDFTAYAFNEDRVKSDTAAFTYRRPVVIPAPRRVFVLAFGIDAYQEARLRLHFAARDAQLIADRLATLPGGEKARLALMADDGTPGGAQVTRAAAGLALGILGGAPREPALAKLAAMGIDASQLDAARPDDVVIVSYSGHGWADPKGNFYILPADTKWPDETKPPDVDSMISTADMTRFLGKIDAGEMALIIDACQSAASIDSGGFKAGPMGDAGLGQLAFDKGLRILAATQADKPALESDRLGQGLLTYALADEGITAAGGRADIDGDHRITLDEWLRYATHRLPSLSREAQQGKLTAARGVVLINRSAEERPVQEPSLFDFTGKPSPLVLRKLQP